MLAFVVALAHAQDFELFRPVPDAYGYLAVPWSATLSSLQIGLSVWGDYENDPIVLTYEGLRAVPQFQPVSGDDGEGVVDDRFTTDVQLGIGLSRFFSFTLDLPVVVSQDGY